MRKSVCLCMISVTVYVAMVVTNCFRLQRLLQLLRKVKSCVVVRTATHLPQIFYLASPTPDSRLDNRWVLETENNVEMMTSICITIVGAWSYFLGKCIEVGTQNVHKLYVNMQTLNYMKDLFMNDRINAAAK